MTSRTHITPPEEVRADLDHLVEKRSRSRFHRGCGPQGTPHRAPERGAPTRGRRMEGEYFRG